MHYCFDGKSYKLNKSISGNKKWRLINICTNYMCSTKIKKFIKSRIEISLVFGGLVSTRNHVRTYKNIYVSRVSGLFMRIVSNIRSLRKLILRLPWIYVLTSRIRLISIVYRVGDLLRVPLFARNQLQQTSTYTLCASRTALGGAYCYPRTDRLCIYWTRKRSHVGIRPGHFSTGTCYLPHTLIYRRPSESRFMGRFREMCAYLI